ncbi:unannotated protein [freshwater metagenome]|uniref:Unannotated protein n=1 Tax=freshwater metagenome TaxID=449393 RepID=A0A6J6KH34_9ZZZZ|nr:hypothetical protein [Actinomycetota bacterium]
MSFLGMVCISIIFASCGSSQSTDSDVQATTTTVKEGATWVIVNPIDAYAAPFAQAVCDTLTVWKPPVDSTTKEVADFTKRVAALKRMIGSPDDATFSMTYWGLYGIANAALEYERKYPNAETRGWSLSMGIRHECVPLNLTEENSKYALMPD